MIALVKALIPGSVLTYIVSMILGSQGSGGGFLNIHGAMVSGHEFYWSWPLFLAATGLAWGIMLMMD